MKDNRTAPDKKEDYRTFLSLGDMGDKLESYAASDPRFKNRSAAAIHLLRLGMKADKRAREKALKSVKVEI